MSRLRYVLLMLALALAVRVAVVLVFRDPTRGPDPAMAGPTADDVEFEALARRVASGEGYVNAQGKHTSFRAPGWPLFLAGFYYAGGTHPAAVYALNCLLGALSCLLAYLLALRLFDEKGARLAGWLAALYLPHAWFATLYLSENLFVPLLGASTLLLMRRQGLAAGLLLGAAILTRPFVLLLAPLWAAWLLFTRNEEDGPRWASPTSGTWAAAVLFGLATAAPVVPWTLRNHAVHGRWVLAATNGGSTFYGGNNPRVVREWRLWGSWVATTDLPRRDEIETGPDEASRDGIEWRLGKEWLAANPLQAAVLMPLKVLRLVLWLPDWDGGRAGFVIRVLCWLPYLALLLSGLCRVPWGSARWWPAHAVLLATVMTALIFWGSPRFRDADMPVLMLYAAAALARPRDESCSTSTATP